MMDDDEYIPLDEANRQGEAKQPKLPMPEDDFEAPFGGGPGDGSNTSDRGKDAAQEGNGRGATDTNPRPTQARARQSFQPANPNYRAAKVRAFDPLEWGGTPAPERRWTVLDWIPLDSVTMLSGDGGTGKSILAMQLLTAAASGKAFLNQQTMRCRCLGIFAEDSYDELHRRQEGINRHFDIAMADLGDMALVSRVGVDSLMMEFGRDGGYESRDHGEPTEFFQGIYNLAVEYGAQLVVLDALHDFFGGNENSRPHARQFVNLLRKLAMDIEGAVVLCAHPSLSGLASGSGTSGSTAWNNAVRSRLYLAHVKDEDEHPEWNKRALRVMKSNYGRTGDEISLHWRDGSFERQHPPSGFEAGVERRTADTAFLEALDALTAQRRKTNSYPNQSNYAPKMMVGMSEASGFRRRDLAKAMERLFHAGKIVLLDSGTPSRPRQYIARPPEGQGNEDLL